MQVSTYIDKPLVTVVITFYNNGRKFEDFLKKLTSAPPYVDVLCVDDGSTDDTLEVLRKYEGLVRVISHENTHVFGAFSFGFRHIKGTYVHAIDADDDLDLELYRDIKRIVDNDLSPDMFIFPKGVMKRNKRYHVKLKLPKGYFEITNETFFKFVQPDNYHKIDGFRWNKVFKSEIITNLVNTEDIYNERLIFFEDFVHTLPSMCYVKTVYHLPKSYYTYYIHPGSISHSPKMCSSFFNDELKIFPYFERKLKETGKDVKKLSRYRYMSYAACYYFLIIYKQKELAKKFRKSYFYKDYSKFLFWHQTIFYFIFKLRLNFLLRLHARFYIFM